MYQIMFANEAMLFSLYLNEICKLFGKYDELYCFSSLFLYHFKGNRGIEPNTGLNPF